MIPRRPVAVLLGALLLGACAREEAGGADATPSLTILYPSEEDALGPNRDTPAKFLVFLPLTGSDANGEPTGRLARRWEHSEDYRTWTYHLRTDLKWHDGAPVTAHDVKFTYDLFQAPSVAMWAPGTFSVEVLDDSTVRVLHDRKAIQVPDLWTAFLPKHLLEKEDPERFAEWEFWKRPVGNGPYRVARFVPNEVIEYEAVPEYPLRAPRINRVRFKVSKSAVTELLSGSVDAAYPQEADLAVLAKDPRFVVYRSTPYNPRAIYWSLKNFEPFRDVRIRRALTMALDRRELHHALGLPPETPIADGAYTERQLRRPAELPPPVPFDTAGARRLLAEAGWRDSDGDGVLDTDGRPFRFAIGAASGGDNEKTVVLLQAQLRRVGVQVDAIVADAGVARRKVEAGEIHAVIGPTNYLHNYREVVAPSNGYGDPYFFELLERRFASAHPAEIDSLESEIAEVLRRDLPFTYLYPVYGTAVAHRRVHGLSSPWRADPAQYMDELWLEDPR